jgi:hypothetical protein
MPAPVICGAIVKGLVAAAGIGAGARALRGRSSTKDGGYEHEGWVWDYNDGEYKTKSWMDHWKPGWEEKGWGKLYR